MSQLKQYIYSSEVVGLAEWPSGTLRLEGIEVTTDPDKADVFVVPGNMSIFKDDLERLDRLPYMLGRESRHCILDVSDNFTKALERNWLIFRCDARNWMLKDDPGTIQVGWPVEDYAECVELPEGGTFLYDVSFQGWLSTQTRIDSSNACKDNAELKSDIVQYNDFTGYIYHEPEGIRRRAEFRRSMKESRIALCPESIPGVLPYRFFEAMSAGRIPLLVSSDFVLPFERLAGSPFGIPYVDFTIFCESKMASCADRIVSNFVSTHSDDEIVAMGLKARRYWVQYLDSRDWPLTMATAVKAKLKEMACA